MQQAAGVCPGTGRAPQSGAELRRVSVYAGSVRVDLALPANVPIGFLMPPIVDMVAGRPDKPEAVRHQLSLPGNVALDPSKTLAQIGIRDGTTLILTSTSAELTTPCFDDAAEAVSVSLAATVRPWTRQAARLIGALTATWLAGTGAAVLIRTAFDSNDARRTAAGVAVAVGFFAVLAATTACRLFRDRTAGLTLGLVACGFAALAGLLAVPGGPGASNVLLAMAAAATLAAVMRVMGCCAVVFDALSLFSATAALAAAVCAVTAVPVRAIAAASAVISLAVVEASARVSILLAGLSPRLESESDDEPPQRLNDKVIRANSWLTSLIIAFSAAAALGAIGAACSAGGPPWLGVAFATVTGAVLLLRARSYNDLAKSVPLIVSGTATLGATLVIAAVAAPPHAPYIAAAATILAATALCLGLITPTTISPVSRRSVELLEYLALATIVPLALWICGLYSASRGLNLL